MKKKFAAIGECMIELTENHHHQFNMQFAGDTFNTTYYLAQLTHLETYYVSAMGADPYSQKMKLFIKEQEINMRFMFEFDDLMSGLYFVKTDTKGERVFYYYRETSAARHLFSHAQANHLSELKHVDMLYTSGISLAILHDQDKLLTLCHDAKTNNVSLYFDNNYRERLWSSPARARHYIDKMHELCDIVFVTFDDEALLYGDMQIDDTIKRYQAKTLPMVVIKNGAHGVYVLHQHQIHYSPSPRINKVIDTTGAGDSFNAAFIDSIVHGQSIQHACEKGHTLACKVIQHQGALMPMSENTVSLSS